MAETVSFYIFATLILIGTFLVTFQANILYAVLSLILVVVGISGLFILLNAPFLAALFLLVYIGGIVVVFIFAVSLSKKIYRISFLESRTRFFWPAILLGCGFLFVSHRLFVSMTGFSGAGIADYSPTMEGLGDALLSYYILPFEMVSFILLAILIGVLTLLRGKKL